MIFVAVAVELLCAQSLHCREGRAVLFINVTFQLSIVRAASWLCGGVGCVLMLCLLGTIWHCLIALGRMSLHFAFAPADGHPGFRVKP